MIMHKSFEPAPDSQTLETISVGDFFQQINWHGRQLSETDDAAIVETLYETVGQFFGTFPWHGSATPESSPEWNLATDDESIPLKTDTLTLEDLSALF